MMYPQNITYVRSLRYIIAWYYCIAFLGYKISTTGLEIKYIENYPGNSGWISPSDEVIKHVGQDLEIFCSLDLAFAQAANFSSADLNFMINNTNLDLQNVTRVNETTVSLFLSNRNESDDIYVCVLAGYMILPASLSPEDKLYYSKMNKLKHDNIKFGNVILRSPNKLGTPVDTVRVMVGEKPKNTLNFRCMLYHFSFLKCRWDVQRNYVPTKYRVQYALLNSTNIEGNAAPFKCPTDNDIKSNFCLWERKTNPPYLNTYENLNVTLIGENAFGKIVQVFMFNQNEHVILNAPGDLHFDSRTSNSVTLLWLLDGIHHTLEWNYTIRRYTDLNFTNLWSFQIDSANVSKSGKYFSFTVTELTPDTMYYFDIRMKLQSAPVFNEYWSDYSKRISVKTRPLPATHVAETTNSLFEIQT